MRCDRREENGSLSNDRMVQRDPCCPPDGAAESLALASWRSQLPLDASGLDADLRHAQRLVAEVRSAGWSPVRNEFTSDAVSQQPVAAERLAVSEANLFWSKVCWISFCLSASTCLAGIGCLGWAEWAGQSAWGRVGWPLLLVGQTGVILSALLQIEARWRARQPERAQGESPESPQQAWWKPSAPSP